MSISIRRAERSESRLLLSEEPGTTVMLRGGFSPRTLLRVTQPIPFFQRLLYGHDDAINRLDPLEILISRRITLVSILLSALSDALVTVPAREHLRYFALERGLYIPQGSPLDEPYAISSPFGCRTIPSGSSQSTPDLCGGSENMRLHEGVDLVRPAGNLQDTRLVPRRRHVKATAYGRVEKTGYDPYDGQFVFIRHGRIGTGVFLVDLFAHSTVLVSRLQFVTRGQEIARAGHTGAWVTTQMASHSPMCTMGSSIRNPMSIPSRLCCVRFHPFSRCLFRGGVNGAGGRGPNGVPAQPTKSELGFWPNYLSLRGSASS